MVVLGGFWSEGLQRVLEDFGLQVRDVLDQLVHPLLGAGKEHRHWNLWKEEIRIRVNDKENILQINYFLPLLNH